MVVDPAYIRESVATALAEDIGSGDITAALLPAEALSKARLVAREDAVLCGCDWFNEAFLQLDESIQIDWQANDGDDIHPDQIICQVSGPSRALLTAERTAINFLQTLSGTATLTRQYVELIKNTSTQILDTRKTLPGLRLAQKYAVACGGGKNHRIGLYDAYLIKENHIFARGSMTNAITEAKKQGVPVEVEVENLAELEEALSAAADSILLDNFSLEDLAQAVKITRGRAKLEASGNMTKETILAVAKTGVDYISIGALTKNVSAVDFSLRFQVSA